MLRWPYAVTLASTHVDGTMYALARGSRRQWLPLGDGPKQSDAESWRVSSRFFVCSARGSTSNSHESLNHIFNFLNFNYVSTYISFSWFQPSHQFKNSHVFGRWEVYNFSFISSHLRNHSVNSEDFYLNIFLDCSYIYFYLLFIVMKSDSESLVAFPLVLIFMDPDFELCYCVVCLAVYINSLYEKS